ncbi:MAG: CoA pyrophosphatase [Chloroflexota bacterium]
MALRQHIDAHLRHFTPVIHDDKALKKAAVALTVVNVAHAPNIYDIPFQAGDEQNAALVLTQRASKLRKHAVQWALPGGRMEPNETAEEAALRELEEEVGLTLSPANIIGRLDDFTTRSGYIMKPIVVWGGTGVTLKPNPSEVASVHRLPVAEFMREDAPILQDQGTSKHPVLLMPVGTSWLAAPTAALLYQFREVAILGRETRVAHFEQPRFAWS